MSKTAADQIAEMMIDAGIQHVYGVVGDSINPIVDAISQERWKTALGALSKWGSRGVRSRRRCSFDRADR